MPAPTLQFDLPDAERPSVWPWLIGLVAAAAMLAVVAQKLDSIPDELEQQGQQIVDDAGFTSIQVLADGRDLTLRGEVTVAQSVADVFAALGHIPGVRVVRDDLRVFDPEAEAAAATDSFLQALARINTSSVAFQAGSASFTAASDTALNQIATLMDTYPDIRIRIEGHTDDTGPEAVNLRLSRERAQAVANYLIDRGVSGERLIAKGYGSTQPLENSTTETARARNRRIEISYVD